VSRSKRKTPITGITTAESEKRDKRIANKNLRRVAKTTIQKNEPEELTLTILREVSNVWDMKKEGKQYFNEKKNPKFMRK
jgi:hypothetical protein